MESFQVPEIKSGNYAYLIEPEAGLITHIMFVEDLGSLQHGRLKVAIEGLEKLLHLIATKEILYGGSQETN